MKKIMKQMKWDVIMTSILYVALGIVVLAMPGIMFKTLGYLIGAFLIVAGAVSMVCYLLREAHRNYFRNDFLYGLIEITVGIIVLYKVDKIMELVPIMLGILVVASGCRKLQDAIDMKRLEYGGWIAMLVLAAVNVIFGVVLILNPIAVERILEQLIGIGLIISGVTDCVITFYFAGIIKKYMDRFETVDSTGVEITDTDGKAGKSEAGAKSEAGVKSETEAKSEPEAGAGSEIEAGAESETEAESGIKDGIEADSKSVGEDKGEEQ